MMHTASSRLILSSLWFFLFCTALLPARSLYAESLPAVEVSSNTSFPPPSNCPLAWKEVTPDQLRKIVANHARHLTMKSSPDSSSLKANLCKANLIGANLRGMDLSGANLYAANLWDANLSNANLSGADLRYVKFGQAILKDLDLSEANLSHAYLNGVNLSGVNLQDANLTETELDSADLTSADLSRAKLIRARIRRANLTDARLTHADLTHAYLTHATLIHADLTNANLSEAHLLEANLFGTMLDEANLSSTTLQNASLSSAILTGANLSKANLWHANLFDASLRKTNLSDANLSDTSLVNASLEDATLYRTDLDRADLTGAFLDDANLLQAQLTNTDLTDASLRQADLTDAQLRGSNLTRAVFEPKSNPAPSSFLGVKGLWTMTYSQNRSGLAVLRQDLAKAGMRQEEREVTYALKHTEREWAWNSHSLGDKAESLFNLVLFELPSDYGMSPGRPLRILGALTLLFSAPYMLAVRRGKGIKVVWPKELIRDNDPFAVAGESLDAKPSIFFPKLHRNYQRSFSRTIISFSAVLVIGFYFSVLSTFHIGWREFSFGTWLSRIQPREYTLVATGWVRSVAGIQSVISVYLLALWVLTYFGRPFE